MALCDAMQHPRVICNGCGDILLECPCTGVEKHDTYARCAVCRPVPFGPHDRRREIKPLVPWPVDRRRTLPPPLPRFLIVVEVAQTVKRSLVISAASLAAAEAVARAADCSTWPLFERPSTTTTVLRGPSRELDAGDDPTT